MILSALGFIATMQASPVVVLPGLLDLPLAEGSTLMADCGWLQETVAKGGKSVQCVTSSLEGSNDVVRAYIQSAKTQGWGDGGGEANVARLYRHAADGACEEMGLAVFPASEASGPADPAIIIIAGGPSDRCPSPSTLP